MASVEEDQSVEAAVMLEIETERQIMLLIRRAARFSDEQRYMEWFDLFVEDCRHAMITRENYLEQGLHNYVDRGKSALQERVAYLMGVWQTPRGKTTHLVSVLDIELQERDTARVVSNFIVARAAPAEDTKLYASGQYIDEVVIKSGRWLFKDRTVILDSNFLPASMVDLV